MGKPRSIRVIYAPQVHLVGVSTPLPGMEDFFEAAGVDDEKLGTEIDGPERLVEVAGRLCYRSFDNPRPGGWPAYIGHIIDSGHGSVLEHVCLNFVVTGVPRSFTHQTVRHRAGWSYSELSQRFVDSSDVAFVVPPQLREEVEAAVRFDRDRAVEDKGSYPSIAAGLTWVDSCWKAQQHYKSLVRHLSDKMERAGLDGTFLRKRAREAARSVLPECTETWIFATANARALRHYVEARTDVAADATMRRVAHLMARAACDKLPGVFGDYAEAHPDDAGIPTWITPHRKV